MRELGERGKGGFEGGELEVGDGHGENPSFSIPFPFWIAIACLNFFLSLYVGGQGRETKKFCRVRNQITLHPLSSICV
jgi:hypothetical protein